MVNIPCSPIKIWGKSVMRFLSYDRTYKQTNKQKFLLFICRYLNKKMPSMQKLKLWICSMFLISRTRLDQDQSLSRICSTVSTALTFFTGKNLLIFQYSFFLGFWQLLKVRMLHEKVLTHFKDFIWFDSPFILMLILIIKKKNIFYTYLGIELRSMFTNVIRTPHSR